MFFAYLLALSCIAIILWEIRLPEKIYQYPFLSASIFLSFLVPQAFSLARYPLFLRTTSIEQTLLMSCLCFWMTWLGYRLRPNSKLIKKLNVSVDERKLVRAGKFLATASFLSSIILRQISISTNDVGNWTGPATILFFFGNLRYIAIAIFLISLLKKHTTGKLFWLCFAILPVLEAVIVSGRRNPTFILLVAIGASLFFVKRWTPPKLLIVLLIILGSFLIPLIGQMRGDFWLALFTGGIGFSDIFAGLDRVLIEGGVLELRNAAMLIEAANHLQKFGLGTGFWSDIIFQYVPGQLVGYDIKQALQIDFGISRADLIDIFGTAFPTGSTRTGIGDSYAEFWYFGCLVFGFIAYFYRHIWISAFYCQSVISQVLYIGLLSPAMLAVTHGVGRFLQDAIFQMIFVGIAFNYSKIRK